MTGLEATFPARLAARLQRPLPGRVAQQRWSPELAYGRHSGPAAADARPAAVCVLFYWAGDDWHLPLIVRPATMQHHAGQVSLPGGRVEQGETSTVAALRELHEELGIASDEVRVVGRLSSLYLYNSNFDVTPWVAIAAGQPRFIPAAEEVAALITLPMKHLLDPQSAGTHIVQLPGFSFKTPHLLIAGQQVWGATAMILGELAVICHDCCE